MFALWLLDNFEIIEYLQKAQRVLLNNIKIKTHEKKVGNTHIKMKGHPSNYEVSAAIREINSVDVFFPRWAATPFPYKAVTFHTHSDV